MNTLIDESLTGEAADPFTGNHHTKHGYEQEGPSQILYEEREDVKTTQVGIILNTASAIHRIP